VHHHARAQTSAPPAIPASAKVRKARCISGQLLAETRKHTCRLAQVGTQCGTASGSLQSAARMRGGSVHAPRPESRSVLLAAQLVRRVDPPDFPLAQFGFLPTLFWLAPPVPKQSIRSSPGDGACAHRDGFQDPREFFALSLGEKMALRSAAGSQESGGNRGLGHDTPKCAPATSSSAPKAGDPELAAAGVRDGAQRHRAGIVRSAHGDLGGAYGTSNAPAGRIPVAEAHRSVCSTNAS
jgi:hypothetical protein